MIEGKLGRLSVKRQCHLRGISRSSIYWEKSAAKDEDFLPMRKIDEQYLNPQAGAAVQ